MTDKIDSTFHSEKDSHTKLYQLASGHISQTAILFEKEGVVAVIQANGSVEFYNTDGVLIAAGSVPAEESGKGVYEEVSCQVENNLLTLRFPIYEWIDNYPHCDGEHDRWDTRIVGFYPLTLDLSTGSLV